MDRIKVFFFIPSLEQGGAERQILALMSRLPARFEPVLAVWHDERMHFRELLPPGQRGPPRLRRPRARAGDAGTGLGAEASAGPAAGAGSPGPPGAAARRSGGLAARAQLRVADRAPGAGAGRRAPAPSDRAHAG